MENTDTARCPPANRSEQYCGIREKDGKGKGVLKHGNLPPSEIQLNILIEVEAIGLISHYYFIAIIIIRLKKTSFGF